MSTQVEATGFPKRILLATDLSARCDRALERSSQLVREWKAELVAVYVLEPSSAPDFTAMWIANRQDELVELAQNQLVADLADAEIPASARVTMGDDSAAAIKAVGVEAGCDFIVTGMARNERLGRVLLGDTVERLAHSARQPLLVVRNRVRETFRHVLVATDFSKPSLNALRATVQLFPDRAVTLYHGTRLPPYVSRPEAEIRNVEENECAEFLAASQLSDAERARVRVVIEHGALDASLAHFIRSHAVDLAVLGARGRSRLTSLLLGSTAATLLRTLPCDTMIIRDPWHDA